MRLLFVSKGRKKYCCRYGCPLQRRNKVVGFETVSELFDFALSQGEMIEDIHQDILIIAKKLNHRILTKGGVYEFCR